MNRLARLLTTVLSGGGAAVVPTYATTLRDTYGASEVYPLTNIPSGTTIHAFVSGAHDGVLAGGTLQNVAGPVTGGDAPAFDGTTAYWHMESLAAIWNGGIGAWGIFGKVDALGTWSDGIQRYLTTLQADGSNRFQIYKLTTADRLQVLATIGGVAKAVNVTTNTTDWFFLAVTWKDAAHGDEVKVYFNGAQVGTTQTGNGTWAGALTIARLACSSSNTLVWKGALAYEMLKFGSVWSDTDIANMYTARLTAGADINP